MSATRPVMETSQMSLHQMDWSDHIVPSVKIQVIWPDPWFEPRPMLVTIQALNYETGCQSHVCVDNRQHVWYVVVEGDERSQQFRAWRCVQCIWTTLGIGSAWWRSSNLVRSNRHACESGQYSFSLLPPVADVLCWDTMTPATITCCQHNCAFYAYSSESFTSQSHQNLQINTCTILSNHCLSNDCNHIISDYMHKVSLSCPRIWKFHDVVTVVTNRCL